MQRELQRDHGRVFSERRVDSFDAVAFERASHYMLATTYQYLGPMESVGRSLQGLLLM